MLPDDAARRMELGEKLRALKQGVAASVGLWFPRAHPEWLIHHPEADWCLGEEGARHHVDALAGAVESRSPAAFLDYTRWAAGVLQSRGMPPHVLAETLDSIGEALSGGLDASEWNMVSSIIETARAASLDFRRSPSSFVEDPSLGRGTFLQAILLGDRKTAQEVVDGLLHRGIAVLDIYTEVFEPCLKEVGRLWDSAEITVAVEHMATAVTQFLMSRLFSSLPLPHPLRGRALITGVEGDRHQVGGNMIADALTMSGWDVRFLGADVPQRGVLEVIGEHKPVLVGISSALLSGIPRVIRLSGAVRSGFPEARVIVGGAVFQGSKDLWKGVGADGWAPGVKPALEMVDGLFPPGG